MKKIIIYVILLMLFGFTSSYAQATKAKTTENSSATVVIDDPKFSPEEKALLSKAGDNPAKIDESQLVDSKVDPKSLPTEDDFGASNAKPAEEMLIDQKLANEKLDGNKKETSLTGVKPVNGRTQPSGEKAGTVTNYRDLPSAGKDQPGSDSPQNTVNYRNIPGTKDQPTGNIPVK